MTLDNKALFLRSNPGWLILPPLLLYNSTIAYDTDLRLILSFQLPRVIQTNNLPLLLKIVTFERLELKI